MYQTRATKNVTVVRKHKFELGTIVQTSGAQAALAAEDVRHYLARHACGDWGNISDDDKKLNDADLKNGEGHLLSSYVTKSGTKIWVCTEHDRSSTCVLLPEEY